MLASIWLLIAGGCLLGWYFLLQRPSRKALGIDSTRVPAGLREGRETPVWLLYTAQVAVLVGLAPLFSATVAMRYGVLPAIIWTLAGSMLLCALPAMSALWMTLRTAGKGKGEAPQPLLSGSVRLPASILGWLMAVLMIAVLANTLASTFKTRMPQPQTIDFVTDVDAFEQARQDARVLVDAPDPSVYVDFAAHEAAVAADAMETETRSMLGMGVLGLIVISALLGFLLFKRGAPALPCVAVAVVLAGVMAWVGTLVPIDQSRELWNYLLLGYALVCGLVPARWMSRPRDMIAGILMLLIALACTVGAVISPVKVVQPLTIAVADGTQPMLPFLLAATLAGGANALYMLSTPKREGKYVAREHHAYPIVVGGVLTAAFVGVLVVVASGAFRNFGTISFEHEYIGPLQIMGSLASLLTGLGIPAQPATLAVMLGFVACGLGALDVAVRMGGSLLHGIMVRNEQASTGFPLERMLAVLITVAAALLMAQIDFWAFWPFFGAVSLGLCAVALSSVVGWLRAQKRGALLLTVCMVVLAALSLWSGVDTLIARLNALSNVASAIPMLVISILLMGLLVGTVALGLLQALRPEKAAPPVPKQEAQA